jgi:hypothetical protein
VRSGLAMVVFRFKGFIGMIRAFWFKVFSGMKVMAESTGYSFWCGFKSARVWFV